MPVAATLRRRGRPLTLERTAPALALLAHGAYARQAAEHAKVSIATILNWMDWAWKHRDEVTAYLRERYPDLSEKELQGLWERIERRRTKRERRGDFSEWRSRGT